MYSTSVQHFVWHMSKFSFIRICQRNTSHEQVFFYSNLPAKYKPRSKDEDSKDSATFVSEEDDG